MSPLETYAQVILHSGCAIPPINETKSRHHRWDECRDQKFFLRVARKHQHKLKSNGIVIGAWIHVSEETMRQLGFGSVSQQAEETDSKPV